MEVEWIIRIVLLGIVHWILAALILRDMADRKKVFGGHKWPWVLAVVFITCLGSLIYILFHPQMLYTNYQEDDNENDWNDKR